MAQDTRPDVDQATERRHHQPGFHTVLVVDDETGIRKGCQRVLSADNHTVLVAETAEEALLILGRQADINLALVDLKLPGMSGLELLSEIAARSPETVCVVITAYATLESAVEATKRGAYDFLTKPFTPDELIRVSNKALERAHLLRERNRLQAERELRLLELATEQSRLRTIINCMADGILVCNAAGDLVLHNPGALRVLPKLQPGRPIQPLREVLEPEELLQMIEEAQKTGKRLSREIELVDLPGGGWVLADVAPVMDEASGRFLGDVTVLRDITALKRVEQVKAQFVNMVAHELRAPLAAVGGYLSIMQQGLVPDQAKQQEMLQRSSDRLKALLDLVNDLLDVARMEAGTVRREIVAQKLPELIAEVSELMAPLARERQVTIEQDLADDLPMVEADREEIIRLLNNLTSNAIKYNKPGGRVTIRAACDGPYVSVSVSDTGVGISEEGLGRLFSEFFREKRPETSYVTGTGLGLSIVKRIVDFYHGRITAQSKLGEGSTFTVWLPCKFQPHLEGDGAAA